MNAPGVVTCECTGGSNLNKKRKRESQWNPIIFPSLLPDLLKCEQKALGSCHRRVFPIGMDCVLTLSQRKPFLYQAASCQVFVQSTTIANNTPDKILNPGFARMQSGHSFIDAMDHSHARSQLQHEIGVYHIQCCIRPLPHQNILYYVRHCSQGVLRTGGSICLL